MRVLLFQDRFEAKVRVGVKRQTIRKTARCVPGDYLSLRRWFGKPYRSRQEWIKEATCREVIPVHIERDSITIGPDRFSTFDHLAVEAQADGFGSWAEMVEWFTASGGLPFDGFVVKW
ncbi:MAG: hypothetical protein ABII76_16955 [Pseudomonadota bacterium]